MKKILIFTALTLFSIHTNSKAQGIPIREGICSINAWLIDAADPNLNTFASSFIAQLPAIKASGARYIRIGGTGRSGTNSIILIQI